MQSLIKNIVSVYGEEGKHWVESLPSRLSTLIKKYNIEALTPVANMTFNYVGTGYQNSHPIILKICSSHKALMIESLCLQSMASSVVPKVIASEEGMILMSRAIPGFTLNSYFSKEDLQATKILCSLVMKLHNIDAPIEYSFQHIKDLLKTIDTPCLIPESILQKARSLKNELLNSTTKEVLLHGDLHHDNILKSGEKWIAIDPKGFIGDPAFDLAAYICNPIPGLIESNNPLFIINQRIQICSNELGIPKQRIFDWVYVKAVLCWAWSLEDNLDPSHWEKIILTIS